MQRSGDTAAEVGQNRSRDGGESREALALRVLHVRRWHPRVGDFFSFAPPGASLAPPRHSPEQERVHGG